MGWRAAKDSRIVVAPDDVADDGQDAEGSPKGFVPRSVPRQQVFVVEIPRSQMKDWPSRTMAVSALAERPANASASFAS